jgi:hypothetical protein
MSKNIARNLQSNQGIISYPTQLYLFGHLRILYHNARKYEYQVYKNQLTNLGLRNILLSAPPLPTKQQTSAHSGRLYKTAVSQCFCILIVCQVIKS